MDQTAVGHSRDVGHGGLRAGAVRGQGLRDPDGWQVVPVRRKVGALRKRFDLDPTNLSLLGGQAGVPV